MSQNLNCFDEQTALERCQFRYHRIACTALRERGESWPIIPDRRWVAEEDESGNWIVSGYETVTAMHFDDPPIVKWRVGPKRLVRLI